MMSDLGSTSPICGTEPIRYVSQFPRWPIPSDTPTSGHSARIPIIWFRLKKFYTLYARNNTTTVRQRRRVVAATFVLTRACRDQMTKLG